MSKSENENPNVEPNQQSDADKVEQAIKRSSLTNLTSSPGWKFIVTGFITLLLTIPALLVWGLVEERADRANQVAKSISQGWGQAQRVNGPYLVVPYIVTEKQNSEYVDVRRFAIFSPETLHNESELAAQERKKSIYSTPLYHMKSKLSGSFGPMDTGLIIANNGRPRLNEAFLAMEVSDPTGFRSDVSAILNGEDAGTFSPGLEGLAANRTNSMSYNDYHKGGQATQAQGIHLPLDIENESNGINFEIDLAINGSRNLQVVPSGKTTKISLSSNWPHPGFEGSFLPETRNISETGFDAQWTIPNLARGINSVRLGNQMTNSNSVIEVSLVKPLKFYQLVSRTLKYAIAFFSLVFLSIFILEIAGKQPIHWIQYMLTGLAMVIFYILLLALAEHLGFEIAYMLAAISTTALVSWYIGSTFKNSNIMWVLMAIIGVTYAIMYLILKEDKYALLIGAIIAFTAIAVTMVATRKVDWSKGQIIEVHA